MADIPNRPQHEAKLARTIGRLLAKERRTILDLLGDPPDPDNIPSDFWDAIGPDKRAAARPILEKIYLESAERLLAETPVGVDWAVVNESAANWAGRWTYETVTGIDRTSRTHLQQSVRRFFRDGQTMGELTTSIGRIYSPVRAAVIAVTEVTRAASQGEQGMVEVLKLEHGIQMRPFWHTMNDSLVCSLCDPRNGKEIKDGVYPPRHPKCRCFVSHELVMPEEEA